MNMALKADVAIARRENGTEKPIDLVHLSSLTMGDRSLELEILKMFSGQTTQFLSSIEAANDVEAIKRVSHTIKGAAKSIGAFRLADIAAEGEEAGKLDEAAICAELLSIKSYISEIC